MDDYRDYDPIQPRGTDWRGRLKRLLGPVLAVALLLGKWAFILVKASTIFVAVAAYALIFGWKFAVGIVLLILLHETGHYIEARREGLNPRLPVFVPFLGAYVRYTRGNPWQTARVAIAGPIFGGLASLVCYLIARSQHSDLLFALAYFGFFLNLFNLLPFVPLDGGRAMAAMAPWMWFVGFGAMLGLLLVWPNPILLIIVLLGGFETYRRWKQRKQGEEGNTEYYRVKPVHRLLVAGVYVGLIVALAIGMDLTHVERTFSDV
jgi:Zn-dependent protease